MQRKDAPQAPDRETLTILCRGDRAALYRRRVGMERRPGYLVRVPGQPDQVFRGDEFQAATAAYMRAAYPGGAA